MTALTFSEAQQKIFAHARARWDRSEFPFLAYGDEPFDASETSEFARLACIQSYVESTVGETKTTNNCFVHFDSYTESLKIGDSRRAALIKKITAIFKPSPKISGLYFGHMSYINLVNGNFTIQGVRLAFWHILKTGD